MPVSRAPPSTTLIVYDCLGISSVSRAAFEFDGTEPTLDEVLADIEKEKEQGEGSDDN